ncbi:MAG TPA: hypothetical protein VKR82_00175 [Candidatus Acidoferrales bacterium]|nr:hypothetical protein [Candidatus Acidoferrales bacterium]
MNDRAKQKLVQLLDEETLGVLDEPERLEGLLRDYCGDCRKEISALIAALQEDVPADLARGSGEPYPILTARLAGKLHDERNIVPDAAQWAVESWAFALEIAPGSKRNRGAGGPQAGFQGAQQGFMGAGGFSGAAGPGMEGAGEWKMPPPVDTNLQKTPVQDFQGGWQHTPPGPAPPGPPPGPGKTPIQPWPAQGEPWKTPGMDLQPWVPANTAAPPAHNSFLAFVCCLGVTILIAYLIPVYGTLGGLLQIVLVITAMASGIELLLAMVRMMLKRPQPPAFVISSWSFWMTLFGVEHAVLRIFPAKKKSAPQMGAPMAYPNPGLPPIAQSFGQPIGQTPVSPQIPVPNQTPIPQPSPVGVPPAIDGVFCVMCGKTNVKGASSCVNCGEKLYYPEAHQGAGPN